MAERQDRNGELDWHKLIDDALTIPGNTLGVYDRFVNYSFLNKLLLYEQGVREPVATYDRWSQLGRQVLKGSKAKTIIRPIFIEKKDDDGEVQARITRFKAVRAIFALCDTEGPDLPPVEAPTTWNLETALEALDVRRVPFQSLDGNTQGYSRGREFAINPVAVNPLRTTFHELGHIVLGHTTPEAHAEYRTHRGLKEFQAESTAYLAMNELDLMDERTATVSRGYIQSWLHDDRPSDSAIRQVFTATDRILKAGRPAP